METTIDATCLVRRLTLDEHLNRHDRTIARHPERGEEDRRRKNSERAEIEPVLAGGGELWAWHRPPDSITVAIGVAVVRDGRIVKAWLLGVTL